LPPCKLFGLILAVYFFSFHPDVYSQKDKNKAFINSNAEKVYLQLTSQVYTSDQVVWFKAIVLDAGNNVPSGLSQVLYVDLIGMDGEILLHKLVNLKQGIGEGALTMESSYPPGRYLIRAYTKWNANFGENFVFRSYINLVSDKEKDNEGSEKKLAIIEKNGQLKLKGILGFRQINGTLNQRIKVYLDWGIGKDTVTLKQNKKGQYPIDHQLSNEISQVSLSMDLGENLHYSTSVFLQDQLPDLQFFPESGKLIHGMGSKVAFKAIGSDGQGIKVLGDIYDEQGKKVTEFESNVLGMGVFYLQPDSLKKYKAKVYLPNVKEPIANYPLPKVMANGTVLTVAESNEKIRLALTSNVLQDSVFIRASSRGFDYFLIAGKLKDNQLVANLPVNQLPEGIVVFKVEDQAHQPVVERLFYNTNRDQKLVVSSSFDKENYKRREETKVHVKISDTQFNPSSGNISVMVFNDNHGNIKEENIRSYFLLSSELKGAIENPNYYFNKENKDRHEAIDALMLTQGWRNYKYPVYRKKDVFFFRKRD
jgi:hypothetical protein